MISSLHVSIASVDSDNKPAVTPIGTLFLNKDLTAYYFEKYPSKLPRHAKENSNVVLLGVNSNLWFWVKSLARMGFKTYPALKLYGNLGERRIATPAECEKLKRRMRFFKFFKGHDYLWGDMKHVREISFNKAESINLGKMTRAM